MKKISIALLPVLIIIIYIFSAMHSFHQVHKSVYYNNKQLSKKYIEWDEVKNNFKDFLNANLLEKMSNESQSDELGQLSILVTGLASKFVDYAIDTYINADGLSLLIEKSEQKSEIPEPNFQTLIGSISIMKFDSLNSFHVNLENEGETYPVHFRRIGTKWKVVEISFPEDLFDDMNVN